MTRRTLISLSGIALTWVALTFASSTRLVSTWRNPTAAPISRAGQKVAAFVITLEEGTRMGGFGSAFIECAVDQQLDTRTVRVLALPDEFIEHGDRNQLLADHGLSPQAIAQSCRDAVPSSVR